MSSITEECFEDGVISSEFLKAVKTKGSLLYLKSEFGLVKLAKSQFNPRVTCIYTVKFI